jgi:Ethylbenzene dehydrogenase
MKKAHVIIISSIIIGGIAWLTYYGLKHARGVPVPIEKQKFTVLKVKYLEHAIDFNGEGSEVWKKIKAQKVSLVHQVMTKPWPKSLIPPIIVKAFHNRKDIYFYLQWLDDSEDRLKAGNQFPDACALMFPLDKESQPSSLMMGFIGKSNIWQWKANHDDQFWLKKKIPVSTYVDFHTPFEDKETLSLAKITLKSAVTDMVAIRVATITPKELQNVSGRGSWREDPNKEESGGWYVIFKRSLKIIDKEKDAAFMLGETGRVAFAIWNGSQWDRGGRKSISDWVRLEVEK